jgi:uncharacterized protein YehS (DUF1456 family)
MSKSEEAREKIAAGLGTAFGVRDFKPSPMPTRAGTKNFIIRNQDGFISQSLTFNEVAEICKQNDIKVSQNELDEMLRDGVRLKDNSTVEDVEFRQTKINTIYDD